MSSKPKRQRFCIHCEEPIVTGTACGWCRERHLLADVDLSAYPEEVANKALAEARKGIRSRVIRERLGMMA